TTPRRTAIVDCAGKPGRQYRQLRTAVDPGAVADRGVRPWPVPLVRTDLRGGCRTEGAGTSGTTEPAGPPPSAPPHLLHARAGPTGTGGRHSHHERAT